MAQQHCVGLRAFGMGVTGVASVAIAAGVVSAQPSIAPFGPTGTGNFSVAWGTDPTGSLAMGSFNGTGATWTASGGGQSHTPPVGSSANMFDSTASGATVGYWSGATSTSGFIWTQQGGYQAVADPHGLGTYAYGITYNGTAVAGWVGTASGDRASLWTSGGTTHTDLGAITPNGRSRGYAISSNGAAVVGVSDGQAMRWTQSGGMVGLGFLGTTTDSRAFGVSPQGGTVVGTSDGLAFQWTQSTGMTWLGQLGNGYSFASDVSSSGMIVGSSDGRAFVWQSATGMQDLHSYLSGLGTDLTGWNLTTVEAISDNGLMLSGQGQYQGVTTGWVAVIPEVSTLCPLVMMCIGSRRRR